MTHIIKAIWIAAAIVWLCAIGSAIGAEYRGADADLPIGTRLLARKPGEPFTMNIGATNQSLTTLTHEICEANRDVMGCDMVVYGPEQPHPCEINPEQTGCAFYQIEPASGVYE